MRPTREIRDELEETRVSLVELLSHDGALEVVDLQYINDRVRDLKTELRLARVNEE